MINDRVNTLLAELEKEASNTPIEDCKSSTMWKPEKVGDKLHGLLTRIEKKRSKYNSDRIQLVLVIEDSNGDERLHYCNGGTELQIRKKGIRDGDYVLLLCKAIEKLNNGNVSRVVAISARRDGEKGGEIIGTSKETVCRGGWSRARRVCVNRTPSGIRFLVGDQEY